jgi:NADPH-dependent glutamate synthase beta subunit-like oxidoreductase
VVIPDTFNEGWRSAGPSTSSTRRPCPTPTPSRSGASPPAATPAPAGQRAQGYIALIREGRWHDALRVIKMDNPFPGICGRICNHRCETPATAAWSTSRSTSAPLKRFVTDKVYAEPREPVSRPNAHYDQRVAIIGAGPCGLTAAQDLVRRATA